MVLTMHYCGAAVLEAHGPKDVRAGGRVRAHLSTLAFSEAGSRSHFWAPAGTAARRRTRPAERQQELGHLGIARHGLRVVLAAAGGGRPEHDLAGPGLVSRAGRRGPFEGLGLRGNDSSPVAPPTSQSPLPPCSAATAKASKS